MPYTAPIAKENVYEALARHHRYRPDTPAVLTGPTGVGKAYVIKKVIAVHPLAHITGERFRLALSEDDGLQSSRGSQSIHSALTVADELTSRTFDENVGLYRQRPRFSEAQGVLDLHLLNEQQQLGIAGQLSHCEAIGELSQHLRILTTTSLGDLHPRLGEMLLDYDYPVPFPTPDEAKQHLQRALERAGVEIADAALLDVAARGVGYRPDRLANMGLRLRSLGFETLTEEALARHLGREPETSSQITSYHDPSKLEDF